MLTLFALRRITVFSRNFNTGKYLMLEFFLSPNIELIK